jgi:PD-(D/E)XK endonuclease
LPSAHLLLSAEDAAERFRLKPLQTYVRVKGQEQSDCGHRKRLINRRQQGDLGEFSAMEWLASRGALVWIPLGHSPDVDLMAQVNSKLLRVQVKTSTQRMATPTGAERWVVNVATNGGNQSWSGVTKTFDPTDVDFLFALVGDGRRWFIPASVIEGARSVTVGGTKYSEFEIERGQSIEHLVYSDAVSGFDRIEGECLSGQKDSTVNRAAMPTEVRILSPPSRRPSGPVGDM